MVKDSDRLRRKLRDWLQPLRTIPLHPQWLASRIGRGRTAWVAQRASGDVLDVGCAGCVIQAALYKAKKYIGLDYPATASGLYGTSPDVFGNASRLPFPDACFDTILMLDVLEHVTEPHAAMREASRVLRSGGRLLLTIPFAYPLHDQPYDYQRFTKHGLMHGLQEAGLTPTTIHEVADGIEATASCLALALSQGAIDAIADRGWRMLLAPMILLVIPLINIVGWAMSALLPARQLIPAGYYVQADRLPVL
jgi:SAM-dependent methyltransferase